MVGHYLQKRIIADLVECQTARYAELKPSHIEGNVFTYHLRSLIKQKLIVKNSDGTYSLTNEGKLYGINSSLKAKELLQQAHSVIFLSIHDKNRWLLRKRLVQPMFGKIGFMHGEPRPGETIEQAGERILQYRTGLSGNMQVKGSGYICLQENGVLVAYSGFTLLKVSQLSGELIANDAHGENTWYQDPDFTSQDMIPSMPDLVSAIERPGLFFLDKIYNL